MSFLLNLIWIILGGWLVAAGWAIAGLILCLTIVGIPFGIAALRIAGFVLWPFGRELVDARLVGGTRLPGTGLMNLIWILLAGLWLAIAHVAAGILCAVTIIGVPLAVIHFKVAGACFAPLGKRIVDKGGTFASPVAA